MRLNVVPDGVLERFALATDRVPTPLFDAFLSFILARSIMVATRLGIFEALADGGLTGLELAHRCNTDPAATGKLLNALVGAEYLEVEGDRYHLAPVARSWLLRDADGSLYYKMLFEFSEWEWVGQCEAFVRSGMPVDIHGRMTDEQWTLYLRAMRGGASLTADEIAARAPIPRGARDLLDIGGSHGYFSVAMCRRHPALRATVLDLPDAVRHAAPILAGEGMGDRVVLRPGDALTDDLGVETFDVVFISMLVHHFDAPSNRALMKRAARALRPGGVLLVFDFVRPNPRARIDQVGGLLDLYFALTSRSGSWSSEEIQAWQEEAGLRVERPQPVIYARGSMVFTAIKAG